MQYGAAAFIETMDASSLKVDPDEFLAHMLAHGAMAEVLLHSSSPMPRGGGAAGRAGPFTVQQQPEPAPQPQQTKGRAAMGAGASGQQVSAGGLSGWLRAGWLPGQQRKHRASGPDAKRRGIP